MRIGVIGCGTIARQYLETARRLDPIEIVATADRVPARAIAVEAGEGIPAMSVADLLANAEVDVVPDVPAARIDAHHHFWDLGSGPFPWLTTAEPAVRRTFSPAELGPELVAAGIDEVYRLSPPQSAHPTDPR